MAAIVYSTNTPITLDISSLPTSSSFLTGRESTEVNNSSTLYLDAIVNVRPILGHASTAPVVGQAINIYVWGADTSLTTAPIDVLDGLDSAETISNAAILNSLRPAGSSTVTVVTAGLSFTFMPFAVAPLFGGVLPKFWGLFVAQSQAGALAAAQSALFSFNGVTTS